VAPAVNPDDGGREDVVEVRRARHNVPREFCRVVLIPVKGFRGKTSIVFFPEFYARLYVYTRICVCVCVVSCAKGGMENALFHSVSLALLRLRSAIRAEAVYNGCAITFYMYVVV